MTKLIFQQRLSTTLVQKTESVYLLSMLRVPVANVPAIKDTYPLLGWIDVDQVSIVKSLKIFELRENGIMVFYILSIYVKF